MRLPSPEINKAMNILITGGAGFIGSNLALRLLRVNAGRITILDNLQRGKLGRFNGQRDAIHFVHGDIRDARLLDGAMRGIDIVYHLAAQSSVMGAAADVEDAFSANVTGTFNVLRSAGRSGVKRLVFTSSREVYGEPAGMPVPESAPLRPKNAYGSSKAAGEMCCAMAADSGLETVVVRLANVYGPGDEGRVIPMFVDSALRDLPLTLYGGGQILDFVWIDTVVDALAQAGMGPAVDGPVNVGSGKGVTIAELCSRVIATTGSRSTVRLEANRGLEVSRFVADIDRAKRFFKLESPDDPLFAMDSVVECACRELSGSAASFQTMNLQSPRAGFVDYDAKVWDRQF